MASTESITEPIERCIEKLGRGELTEEDLRRVRAAQRIQNTPEKPSG